MSEIIGLSELLAQLSSLDNLSTHSLLAGALVLQKHSMDNAPVKTGFLRNSHSAKETSDGAEMVVSANYAAFVEFGTSKWEGKAFVRPAIDENAGAIVKAVAEEIEKEIRGKI